MRRLGVGLGAAALVLSTTSVAVAAAESPDGGEPPAATIEGAVRVTLLKVGGSYEVQQIHGSAAVAHGGCRWTVEFSFGLDEAPFGTSVGPIPSEDARLALLLCDGSVVRPIWVAPRDILDLDAVARGRAQRYIEDVLVPAVRIGVNPTATGLVGLESWYWITGFDGRITAPPITAFGMTVEVRMTSGRVRWDFGDGSELDGDLGQAYPAESSVRHAHARDGRFTIIADIALLPEYRVDGGRWFVLAPLSAVATATEQVEERQAVITAA